MTIYSKPGHQFLYTPMSSEMKCLRLYLCLAHSTPSPLMSTQHMHQHDQQWYDPLYIITWSYWFIDLDFTCSSSLLRSIGVKSSLNLSFTLATGPSSQVLSWSLYLDHMTQCHVSCAISSFIITCVSFCNISEPSSLSWHVLLTHMYLWTNHLCISRKHILVHLRLSLNYQNQTKTFQPS
jgi:hypothetical protein